MYQSDATNMFKLLMRKAIPLRNQRLFVIYFLQPETLKPNIYNMFRINDYSWLINRRIHQFERRIIMLRLIMFLVISNKY